LEQIRSLQFGSVRGTDNMLQVDLSLLYAMTMLKQLSISFGYQNVIVSPGLTKLKKLAYLAFEGTLGHTQQSELKLDVA
jgi:hypothetical protein